MKKIAVFIAVTCAAFSTALCVDSLPSMASVGPVSGYVKNADGITLDCADKSQARIYLLAPDLARVRASFTRQLPQTDHSWAIDKTTWTPTAWAITEAAGEIILATSEL